MKNQAPLRLPLLAACAIGLVAASGSATAQTGNPAVDAIAAQNALIKAETEQLKTETEQIKAQIDQTKEEVNLLGQKVPQLSGGKEGSIKFEAGKGAYSIGAWEKVYQRIDEASQDLCAAIKNSLKKGVLVATNEDLASPYAYSVASSELDRQHRELQQLKAKVGSIPRAAPRTGPAGAAAPALAALNVGLSSAISIAKLFRTDKALYSESVTVGDAVLKERVMYCLRDLGMPVEDPALVVRQALLTKGGNSRFMSELNQLNVDRQQLEVDLAGKPAASRPAEAATVMSQADKFFAGMLTVPAGSAEPPLVSVLRGEAVSTRLASGHSLLVVGIAQQGGVSMITSSVWHSDRLYVGGGAIVTFQLTDGDRLVESGVISKVDPALMRVNLETK